MSDYPTKFKNCDDLVRLPYFEKNSSGRTVLALDDAPPIVDFHAHLGSYFLFSSPLDLNRRTGSVQHCFREHELPIDVEVYSGINLKNTRRNGTFGDHAHTIITKHGANASYTVPNILEEMDRMGVDKSVLLAIDILGIQNSMHQLKAVADEPRLIPFCGVTALSPRWEAEMDACLEQGARGIKIHPYAQFLAPNHPRILKLLERWRGTGLPVLFHTANNGLEPAPLRRLSDMHLYEEPLRRFPDITFIFGHAGMTFFETAVKYAKDHGNTYLEIGGQPPLNIRKMIDTLGNDKILFGTDWPFYPLIMPLAKTLLATENDPESRRKILSENAHHLIRKHGLVGAASHAA